VLVGWLATTIRPHLLLRIGAVVSRRRLPVLRGAERTRVNILVLMTHGALPARFVNGRLRS
jgi:hypothetical protein